MRRSAGVLLAVALTALGVALHREAHEVLLDGYDSFSLPGFDAHVYAAMADDPAFFTLPPWGQRILVPWLAHLAPGAPVDAWRAISYAALLASGGLLYLFLRRLGCGGKASLLAVVVFAFSMPVESAVAYPFLVEPVTLLLLLGLLLGLEAGAGAGVLAPLAVLAVLSKEVTLFFLPVVFFARRDRDGWRRSLATALATAAPAALAWAVLRLWWVPAAALAEGTSVDVLWLALWRLIERAPDWWRWAMLGGLTPLALLGALRPKARPWLVRYGYLLAATWALPFVASVYTAAPSVPFFGEDIPRLLLYAMPLTLAFALVALDTVLRHLGPEVSRAHFDTPLATLGALAAVGLALLPVLSQDRYRRADLTGPRDGRFVLAFCRESLAGARRLAAGRVVDLAPELRSFVPGKTLPELAGRMRWFLRTGFGPKPQYDTGPVITREREATLLLPCLQPEDWNLGLVATSQMPMRVRLLLNGRGVGELELTAEPSKQHVILPGGVLFRGDNELRLVAAAPGVRLHELRLRAAR